MPFVQRRICVCIFSGRWSDDQGAVVSLILPQNSEAELLCPTNIRKPSITFLKDGLPFVSRPIGKVGQLL